MLKYLSVASGSKGNCFIIQSSNSSICIDCGGTQTKIKQGLNELNIPVNKLDALLITHSHSDHIAQLKMFRNHNIYSVCTLNTNYHAIEMFKTFSVGDFKITPIPLSHDCPDTCGYIIEAEDEKLVYITDTGYVKESLFKLLKNADYIILEFNHNLPMLMKTNRPMYLKQRIQGDNGHLCNEDAGIILNNIIGPNTKEICLAHLSLEANTSQLALEAAHMCLSKLPYNDYQIKALQQFEFVKGGSINETLDNSCISSASTLEFTFNNSIE